MIETTSIRITVNGREHNAPENCSVADLMKLLAAPGSGVAVAVNDEVVRKRSWDERIIGAGDRVEIIAATAGG